MTICKNFYSRHLPGFLILLTCAIIAAGCSKQEISGNPPVSEPGSSLGSSPSPVSGAPVKVQAEQAGANTAETVVPGRYLISNYSPSNAGVAEITASPEDPGRYHLSVSVVRGYSHHIGSMESDFVWDGELGRFRLTDEEYEDVDLEFAENSLTVDYEGEGFGGANAEPKGTYYLSNTGAEDAPFLTGLFDLTGLQEAYRHGLSDVYSYELDEEMLLLLVRSRDNEDRSEIAEERLALYDGSSRSLEALGEASEPHMTSNRELLLSLGADEHLIYQVLYKTYNDRLLSLEMGKFDEGRPGFHDTDDYRLSEQEAFYIATGVEGTTRFESNARDENDIGSIFIAEVDSVNEETLTVRFYELVRDGEGEEHIVNTDRLEVNRASGRVD
ncbi:hypothetical protein DFP94_108175 [Fontibacillus phaseoli]|uniref:Uncharacterized protein n=1 Tax=Fontibacillus phaseoli TaxID=1416533 RepID=A0A369BDR9_9BACL|nr:hypothetical protein [Fontibacillus phaseoli]RCX17814.1 hypothetical protein DFP94_108175 [Fontibacillus phaseoli]